MKRVLLLLTLLSCMATAASVANTTKPSLASFSTRLVTAKKFQISLRGTIDPIEKENTPHRLPTANGDPVSACYDVTDGRLTVYYDYASPDNVTYIFRNETLALASSGILSKGDSLSYTLAETAAEVNSYTVIVEDRNGGSISYGNIGNDPRFVPRSTYEFSGRWVPRDTVNPMKPSPDAPTHGFHAAVAREVYPTFYKEINSTGSIQVSAESADADCRVFLFLKDNPAAFSQTFTTSLATGDSVSRGTMTYSAPAGTYMLVVTAATECHNKRCSVTVNGTAYSNQLLASDLFPFSVSPKDGQTAYHSFVRGWHCYPQLLILGANGCVVGYKECTDTAFGTDGWTANMHMAQTYSAATTAAIVVPRLAGSPSPGLFLSQPVRLVSLYVGCEKTSSSSDAFKQLKRSLSDSIFYSSLKGYDMRDYYSWSWACGSWLVSDDPTRCFAQDYISNGVNDVQRFDSLFVRHGFVRTANAANSAIDLHRTISGNESRWHAAVRAYSNAEALGYAWESKVEKGGRYFHPRGAVKDADSVYYYRRLSYMESQPTNTNIPPAGFVSMDPDNFVVENEEGIDDSYFDLIWDHLDLLSTIDLYDFDDLFWDARDVLQSDTLSSFETFLNSQEYCDLLSFCADNPEFVYFTFYYVLDGDPLAVTLLEDVYAADYPDVLQQVWTYNRTHKLSANNKGILRTRLANATLFAKTVLDNELNRQGGQQRERRVSYSDDPSAFCVEASGHTVTITHSLPSDARVSLAVTTLDGAYVSRPHNNQYTAAGSYTTQVNVDRPGVYIVTYTVNGRIYCRKIAIR